MLEPLETHAGSGAMHATHTPACHSDSPQNSIALQRMGSCAERHPMFAAPPPVACQTSPPLPAARLPQQRLLTHSRSPASAAAATGRQAWCQPARPHPPAALACPSSLPAAARVSQASQRGLLSRTAAACRSGRQQRLGAADAAIVLSIVLTAMLLPRFPPTGP